MDNKIYSKVFGFLVIGLLVTFGTAYLTLYGVVSSYSFASFLFGSGYIIIAVLEIVIAIVLSARIYKLSGGMAKILYLAYAILTGLTFSSIFIVFDIASIIYVFLATALILGVFALIGMNTKLDLSKIGIYLFMTLLGIIILEVINIFWTNNALDMVLCVVALIIFMVYIAYDVQNVKRLQSFGVPEENLAIIGAFELYLDFINIFLRLLQLFGNRKGD